MLLTTCFSWTEKVLEEELRNKWYTITDIFDTWVICRWDLHDAIFLNKTLRTANKIYFNVQCTIANDFDNLFLQTWKIQRNKYLSLYQNFCVILTGKSFRLKSNKVAQKLIHKSILKNLYGNQYVRFNSSEQIEIRVAIYNNDVNYRLNTTWRWLHERWIERENTHAPIKENIAYSLLSLAWRTPKYRLFDPFCWSWTILREAWWSMNTTYYHYRTSFALTQFPTIINNYDIWMLTKKPNYDDYNTDICLFWSDIDQKSINIAKKNLSNANVLIFTKFTKQSYQYAFAMTRPGDFVITNPPYNKRLSNWNISYSHIFSLYTSYKLNWWFITREKYQTSKIPNNRKSIKLKNWGLDCRFYFTKKLYK